MQICLQSAYKMVKVKKNCDKHTKTKSNVRDVTSSKEKTLQVRNDILQKSGNTEARIQYSQKGVYKIENIPVTRNIGSRLSLHGKKTESKLKTENVLNSSQNNKAKMSAKIKKVNVEVKFPKPDFPNNFKVKKCKVKVKRLRPQDMLSKPSEIGSVKNSETKAAADITCNSIYTTPKSHLSKVMKNVTKEKNKVDTPSKVDKDVYEFSSQSSLSESEDLTAEVVQKLIKEGKASVAKQKPQKVNNVTKKKWKANPEVVINKIKKNLLKEYNLKRKKLNKHITTRKIVHVDLGENEFEHFQQDDHNDDHVDKQENKNSISKRTPLNKIARTAIMNNAINNVKSTTQSPRKMVTDKNKLLEIAKQFVSQSTPFLNKKKPIINNNISPIRAPTSPWRVQNETIVPRLFYFSRDNDDLPSYSSDFFPASQEDSHLNSSNVENIPPSDVGEINPKSKKQIPNPRKTLGSRSPLKPINVIDVLNLPNWRTNLDNKNEKSQNENLSKNMDNAYVNESKNESGNKENQSSMANITGDCFGFDEYIDQEDNTDQKNIKPMKSNLKMKLKSLKRLLPSKPTRLRYSTIRSVFDNEPKQKDIRKMLCSTMIDNNRNEKNISENTSFENSLDLTITNEEQSRQSDVHLFDDPVDEIQCSFDKSAEVRTYTRHTRKRKKLRHNFTMFLTDSESEDEKPKSPRKKKTKREKKTDKELNQFVEQFNSMCEEVDQYKLVVEGCKSTESVA